MKNEIKYLMDKLIEKFGGLFKRENQRTYWETPKGDKHHINTVFLRRMAAQPEPVAKETPNVVEQPKQEENQVNGSREPQPESRRSEEVTETIEKVEEKGTSVETPKKKKKSRKKETKSEVENAPQQGQEDEIKEQE